MEEQRKFEKPEDKSYSVKEDLSEERLLESLEAMQKIQTAMLRMMKPEDYEKIEKQFDTAIASLMAHLCGVPVELVGKKGENDGKAI